MTANDVITEHLVPISDVDELQRQNMRLIRALRKLSDSEKNNADAAVDTPTEGTMVISGGGAGAGGDGGGARVAELRSQVQALKETLTKQETLVQALLQKNAQLTAIAHITQPSSSSSSASNQSSSSSSSTASAAALADLQKQLSDTQTQLRETKAQLDQKSVELEREKDRFRRMTESERALQESLEKMRVECSSLRQEVGRSVAEAKFNGQRAERLDSDLKDARREIESSTEQRIRLQEQLNKQEASARDLQMQLSDLNDKLRVSEATLRQARMERDTAVSAEKRLTDDIESLRESMKRQSAVLESVQRLEASMNARVSEERSQLEQERDSLRRQVDRLKGEVNETTASAVAKVSSADEARRVAETASEELKSKLASAKEESVRYVG